MSAAGVKTTGDSWVSSCTATARTRRRARGVALAAFSLGLPLLFHYIAGYGNTDYIGDDGECDAMAVSSHLKCRVS